MSQSGSVRTSYWCADYVLLALWRCHRRRRSSSNSSMIKRAISLLGASLDALRFFAVSHQVSYFRRVVFRVRCSVSVYFFLWFVVAVSRFCYGLFSGTALPVLAFFLRGRGEGGLRSSGLSPLVSWYRRSAASTLLLLYILEFSDRNRPAPGGAHARARFGRHPPRTRLSEVGGVGQFSFNSVFFFTGFFFCCMLSRVRWGWGGWRGCLNGRTRHLAC